VPSSAKFHIDLLRNYQVLDRPGTFIVTVASDITEDSLYTKDDYPRYLVPLRVIRGDDLIKLVSILNEYKTVAFTAIRRYFMMGAIFADNIDEEDLPAKGEKIIATFEDKDNKLLCTHLKLIDRHNLDYVDVNALNEFYKTIEKFMGA
jgi:hypothetical protein